MIVEIPEIVFEECVRCGTCKGTGCVDTTNGVTRTGRTRWKTEPCPDKCHYGMVYVPTQLGDDLLNFLKKYKDKLI
jgi:hypothetical protein